MNRAACGAQEGGRVRRLENVSSKYDPRSSRPYQTLNQVQDIRLLPHRSAGKQNWNQASRDNFRRLLLAGEDVSFDQVRAQFAGNTRMKCHEILPARPIDAPPPRHRFNDVNHSEALAGPVYL